MNATSGMLSCCRKQARSTRSSAEPSKSFFSSGQSLLKLINDVIEPAGTDAERATPAVEHERHSEPPAALDRGAGVLAVNWPTELHASLRDAALDAPRGAPGGACQVGA